MSEDPEPGRNGPAAAPAPRWMKIALVLSLALNLLVVGALAGAAFSGGHKGRDHAHKMRGGDAGAVTHALSTSDKRALRREIKDRMRAEGGNRQAVRTELETLAALMRAPDTAAPEIETQLGRIQDLMVDRLTTARALVGVMLAGFDAQERAEYADRLEAVLSARRP
ncbi:MAG: periplasmic heavy metal sensor [Pseudomonadota bacterium]